MIILVTPRQILRSVMIANLDPTNSQVCFWKQRRKNLWQCCMCMLEKTSFLREWDQKEVNGPEDCNQITMSYCRWSRLAQEEIKKGKGQGPV